MNGEKYRKLIDIQEDIERFDEQLVSLVKDDVEAQCDLAILNGWKHLFDAIEDREGYGKDCLEKTVATDEMLCYITELINDVHECIFCQINKRLGLLTLKDYE